MQNSFSVILPIHNEEKNLLYSLPSIHKTGATEIICLFDRCTDNSKEVAEKIAKKIGAKIVCLDVNSQKTSFTYAHSFLRFYGSLMASNHIVLFTAADMILDPKIGDYVKLVANGQYGMISFIHKNFPVDWRLMIKRLLVKTRTRGLGSEKWLGAILLWNREVGFESEDIEELKGLRMAQDTHLWRAIYKKHKTLCVPLNIIHLRSMESKRHYLRGQLYWSDLHRSFLVTLLSSIMVLRLKLLKGYIRERYRKKLE